MLWCCSCEFLTLCVSFLAPDSVCQVGKSSVCQQVVRVALTTRSGIALCLCETLILWLKPFVDISAFDKGVNCVVLRTLLVSLLIWGFSKGGFQQFGWARAPVTIVNFAFFCAGHPC